MRRISVAAAWIVLAGAWGAEGQEPKSRPVLAVVVVVDQLRGDYLAAFRNHFGRDGFRRLMDDGAWFSHAYLPYGSTATGPGHATVMTGAPPAIHGIVANDWIDEAAGQVTRYCCGDEEATRVGAGESKKGEGRSPVNLLTPTVGDALKTATGGRAKVWTIAMKDRAAVLTAGHRPNGAVWWDTGTGNLVTSSYYGSALPAWAAELNAAHFADRFFKKSWELLLPREAYAVRLTEGGTAAGGDLYARFNPGNFPKVLGGKAESPGKDYYNDLLASPLANDLLVEAAQKVIVAESLGADADPDLLVLGFSANDVVGHFYGPDSVEVMDCTLRTDQQIATLLTWLDEKFGRERYVFAVTADHGVGPIPEFAVELGIGGGRFEGKKLKGTFEEKLAARFGPAPKDRGYVRDLNLPWLYLDLTTLEAVGAKVDDVARYAADLGREIPGMLAAYPLAEILQPEFAGADEVRQAIRNTTYPGRSGHVYLHWVRYWYKGGNQAGHGAAYDYDQHIPVLIAGPNVRPGEIPERVSPTGMAATLCTLLQVPPAQEMDPPFFKALRVRK